MERVVADTDKRRANDGENERAEDNAGDRPKRKRAPTNKKRVAKKGFKDAPSHPKDNSCSQDPSSNPASFEDVTGDVEDFSDVLVGTPLPVSSSSESFMSKLAGIFSEAQTSDRGFKNATRCVAHVGDSLSTGKSSDYRGISVDITPDFLSSLLSLVRIFTLVYIPFYF